MNNDSERLSIRTVDDSVSLGDCALHSHEFCDAKVCEVQRVLGTVRQGQIQIAVATGIAGIAVSSIFALALIYVWTLHAMAGRPMPDVPWFVLSVALVPFGSAVLMKVPKND